MQTWFVNADAEQVIVASNIGGELNYISGSLENQLINSKICQILEGGELAFEKGEENINKYNNNAVKYHLYKSEDFVLL